MKRRPITRSDVVGAIPGRLEEIRYRRIGEYAGKYKHKFRLNALIIALRDGSLLIRPCRKGQKLWVRL